MPLGSSVNVDAAGANPQVLASETIGSRQYQGVLVCDTAGNPIGTPGNPLAVEASRPPTYTALYRLAARPYPLSFTTTAGGRKQYATVYHGATATKVLRLKRARVAVRSIGGAAIVGAELVRLTAATAPATGNPVITPQPHLMADGAAESACLALPTTGGAEAAGSAYASVQYETAAATGAITSTAPPTMTTPWQEIYVENLPETDDSLVVPSATAGGFAVVIDSNAAVAITALVMLEFTEEAI